MTSKLIDETLAYIHGAMYQLKERIKTANAEQIHAIGDVLYDLAKLVKELEGESK